MLIGRGMVLEGKSRGRVRSGQVEEGLCRKIG